MLFVVLVVVVMHNPARPASRQMFWILPFLRFLARGLVMVLLLAAVLHCRSFGRPVGVSFSGGVAASAGGATTGQGGVTIKFRVFPVPVFSGNGYGLRGGILLGGSVGGRNVAWWCRQGAG